MDKDKAKVKVQELINKYERVVSSKQLKKYNEEETKKDFIQPLFEALGWNISNKNEVTAEESQSGGRVDYGFYLQDKIKFYLEAKPLKADLNKEDYANQAIRYSWNKGVTWAVLTDFEEIKVFNAENISKYLGDKLLFNISYEQFIERFDQLWSLSKAAFGENLLDKEAEKIGKKLQRVSVGALLYKDLNECRNILTKDLSRWNEKVPKDLLDEGVQRILDRLIFIRVAEDRGIEPSTLRPLIRQWENRKDKNKVPLYKSMITKFRELNDIYNSNLFQPHPFEEWQDYSDATKRAVNILYGPSGYYEYDFKFIPADVLGAVYENYLGYRLSQSKKGMTISKDAKKRKEHGIYYTPTFIVDYIVKNALQPVLDKCSSIEDLKKIKVLDPACGSGSFLIKALEVIHNKYIEFGNPGGVFTKLDILLNNIYGVDLDPQAVEIARLNLLVNALDERMKLPGLEKNIKNGNSLISGTDQELEKYFGKNFRDKKPFNWKEEFPDVFKQGGFDVVIGNPPYIDSESMTKTMSQEREYINNHYLSAKGNWDIFCVFIERALNLCKDEGYHSFILPNKLISANYAQEIRRILEKNRISKIRDYSRIKVFDVSVYPIVYIVQKTKPKGHIVIENITEVDDQQKVETHEIDYKKLQNGNWVLDEDRGKQAVKTPENSDKTISLGKIALVTGAATVAEAYILKDLIEEEKQKYKVINSGTINRFESLWGQKEMRYLGKTFLKPTISENALKKVAQNRLKQTTNQKIIMAGMTLRPECVFDKTGAYLAAKSTTVIMQSAYDLRVLLGILNSNFVFNFLKNRFKGNVLQGGYLRLGPPEIKEVPIPRILLDNKDLQEQLIKLVNKILQLIDSLHKNVKESEMWLKIKSEIERTDREIDEEVYKLYGLTPEEIEIVEGDKDHA
jgi:type I restriction-modification system DNA methylase subunit